MSNKLSNSFASTSMAKLYLQSDSADIHFVFPSTASTPSEKVSAHKLLLASASPVFKAMFNGNWNENETVDITDSNASAFKEFLQFIYLPEVSLTIGNIEEVVRLADKYDMLDCFETCAEFLQLNLTSENMVWGYQLAIAVNNAQLKEFCEKHIQNCTDEILRSEMFLLCSREVIDHMLQRDTLECDEVDLFHACIKWAKALCRKNDLDETISDNIKSQLGTQFYSIRFSTMGAKEFATMLNSDIINGLFTRDEVVDIMQSQLMDERKSKFFNHQPRLKPSYLWDATIKLTGVHKSQTEQTYFIQQLESTWFSSNAYILLGEIIFVPIYRSNNNNTHPVFNIDMIEHAKDDFGTNASTVKSLYSKYDAVMNVRHAYFLSLGKAILIRPNKMYEIRMQHQNANNDIYHYAAWVASEAKLNDKIKITFHQNPSDLSITRRGLVSKLNFNLFK